MHTLPSIIQWLDQLSPSERQLLAHLWYLAPQQPLYAIAEPNVTCALWQRLDDAQQSALNKVLAADGMLPAGVLEREFGTLRTHAGFVNPRAYLHALQGTPSVTETLYVLGLLHRIKTDDGLMYAIPQELFEHLPKPEPTNPVANLVSTAPTTSNESTPASLERDLVTLLALAYHEPLLLTNSGALHRNSIQRLAERLNQSYTSEARWHYASFLRLLAIEIGLLDERNGALRVTPTALDWLGLPAFDRLSSLVTAWLESRFDELTTLANLRWRTTPLQRPMRSARRAILELLTQAQPNAWIALDTLISEMQRINPEFARSNADFQAWQITDAQGNSLKGWHNWRNVEGELITAVIAGPLFWLGIVDLGDTDRTSHVRLNAWGQALLGDAELPKSVETSIILSRDGRLTVAPTVAPLPRFQIQRFAVWQRNDTLGNEHLLITLRAFDEANERGISREQIEQFLSTNAKSLPSQFSQVLRDWEQRRQALRGDVAMLLTADDPRLLEMITDDLQHDLPDHRRLNQQTWAFAIADADHVITTLRDHGFGLQSTLEKPDNVLSERDLRALLTAALIVQANYADHGISQALIDRVRHLLPTAERMAAQRDADEVEQRQR